MHGVRGLSRMRAASPDAWPGRDGRSSRPRQAGTERVAQGGHISVEPRINERIRVPEVRLVGPNGEQVGIVALNDALRLAQEADLDLVEVAPTARPPVCKLMDYGKFKYESALKARESRKNQAQTVIKEIKLRPKIDPHDYGTKKSHVERFLRQGDKVKVTIMFRGREQSRPELGFRLLQRLAGDVEELGFVESQPRQDGRNMIMVIGPHRRKSEARAERSARDHGERAGSRHRSASAAAAATAESGRAARGRPAEAAPPAAGTQPAADVEPAGGMQPAAGTQPAADVEPAGGAQPSGGGRPAAGAERPASTPPTAPARRVGTPGPPRGAQPAARPRPGPAAGREQGNQTVQAGRVPTDI
jgi:translation initiation factor IF-3